MRQQSEATVKAEAIKWDASVETEQIKAKQTVFKFGKTKISSSWWTKKGRWK